IGITNECQRESPIAVVLRSITLPGSSTHRSTAPALTPNTLLIEPPENKKTCFYAGGRRETGLAQIHVKKSAKNHKSFLGNHQRQTHLEQYGTWTYNKKLYILKVKIKKNAEKSKT
ncbi:hypothetical protein AAIH08_33795, partial [Pseudomonas aeruginosa]|uniref:hypothetical protein n=1 Tax=Pseudomonas aeruginosa TaxID=287 RepID=UPI0031B6A26C